MITKLAILDKDDGTFDVIEPVTGTLLHNTVDYNFARYFVEGFLDCMSDYSDGKKPNLITIASCQYQLAYHIGMLLASNLCEDWISKQKTFKFFGSIYV